MSDTQVYVAYSMDCSFVVTHFRTEQANHCLTSVIWQEPVPFVWLHYNKLVEAFKEKKKKLQLSPLNHFLIFFLVLFYNVVGAILSTADGCPDTFVVVFGYNI